jgi:hypothetical protein
MADNPRRPLLNPVLRFTKDPKPEGITGGGKTAGGIKPVGLPGSAARLPHNSAGCRSEHQRCRASMVTRSFMLPCSTTRSPRPGRLRTCFSVIGAIVKSGVQALIMRRLDRGLMA